MFFMRHLQAVNNAYNKMNNLGYFEKNGKVKDKGDERFRDAPVSDRLYDKIHNGLIIEHEGQQKTIHAVMSHSVILTKCNDKGEFNKDKIPNPPNHSLSEAMFVAKKLSEELSFFAGEITVHVSTLQRTEQTWRKVKEYLKTHFHTELNEKIVYHENLMEIQSGGDRGPDLCDFPMNGEVNPVNETEEHIEMRCNWLAGEVANWKTDSRVHLVVSHRKFLEKFFEVETEDTITNGMLICNGRTVEHEEATVDDYMMALVKHTFGSESHFMYNMSKSPATPFSLPRIYAEGYHIQIPESRFATYCATVLQQTLAYLENAQITWKHKSFAVMHGGEHIQQDKQKDQSDLVLPMRKRGQEGCLTRRVGTASLLQFLSLSIGTEISGRIPPGTTPLSVRAKRTSYAFENAVKLSIVGHTPQTHGTPVVDVHTPSGTVDVHSRKIIVFMDTQYSDRAKCHSCIAWNDDGQFVIRFKIILPKPVVSDKEFSKHDVFETTGIAKEMTEQVSFTAYGLDDADLNAFELKNSGFRYVGTSEEYGIDLFVKCVSDCFAAESSASAIVSSHTNNIYWLRKTDMVTRRRYLLYRTKALNQEFPMQYVAWGDVEGNIKFLEGCKACMKELTDMGFLHDQKPKIVCLGDVNGPQVHGGVPFGQMNAANPDINEKECIQWANECDIKIIGNRDFIRLRLILEFAYWQKMTEKPKYGELIFKETFKETTFLRKLDGLWSHDSTMGPLTTGITDAMTWETLGEFFQKTH